MAIEPQQRSVHKGLATVAMLKVNFDAGRDHIAMFQPFVMDAIVHLGTQDLNTNDIRREVRSRHELSLPTDTLRTLLGRATRDGYLRREGGRYFRTDKPLEVFDVRAERAQVEGRQSLLAEALRKSAANEGVEITSTEGALAKILEFLEEQHVAMALNEQPERPQSSKGPMAIATARFLYRTACGSGELTDVLQEMLQGFVLQNTLLLKDISTASRRFKDLHVFFDSGLLFRVLGLSGLPAEIATIELVTLLRGTGAVPGVFRSTIQEMRQILEVYEDRIGTSSGRASLYETDLTRHLVTEKAAPSDIRVEAGLIEKKLKALGFNIRETPEHVSDWTLDERALGRKLSEGDDHKGGRRVTHDVDCVAAVLTMRKGKSFESLDNAVAVFATSSGLTVHNTNIWYKQERQSGVSPIIHYIALSNLAWLKKPASAAKLNLHELIALCVAALRPSSATWRKFVIHLKKLEESGELSSDETTAIVASELTERMLVDVELTDDDDDASSLSEVIDRVKVTYKQQSEEEVVDAKRSAERIAAKERRLRSHVEGRARSVATRVSYVVALAVGLSFTVGTIISANDAASGQTPSVGVLVLAVFPLALGGLCSLFWGFHLRAWMNWLQLRLEQWATTWMTGSDGDG